MHGDMYLVITCVDREESQILGAGGEIAGLPNGCSISSPAATNLPSAKPQRGSGRTVDE
jgi:hypothetical protein